jgi:hypothetical protein
MRVLMPLPDREFDVTEVAVPWHILTAFVVQDGNYLSARWPGDAYLFGRQFAAMLSP